MSLHTSQTLTFLFYLIENRYSAEEALGSIIPVPKTFLLVP